MIDWSELKTYQETKYRSFEELCYQIAKGLYGDCGHFTSIDDSGGGDGVEFYMTLPNGDQWGWQAKFSRVRSQLSTRKQSIKKSLEKACQEHTHLKKWILCTPWNLTPKEQKWFENTLCQFIPENMSVELGHWGDSDFNAWLSEPRFIGKWLYFFNKLELDINWFQRQFNKQMASVGEKFSASLHTPTTVDAHVHALLGDKEFTRQITELIEKLQDELSDLKEAIDNLKRPIPNGIEWVEEEKSKVIETAESLQSTLANVICQLEQAEGLLNEERLSEAQTIDWESLYTQLKKSLDNYRTVGFEFGTSKIKYTGKKEYEDQIIREAARTVHRPWNLIANLLDDFLHSALERCRRINHSDLNLLGKAGIGKTHIACNICDDRLKAELPVLFISGIRFTSDRPIEEQLRNILDIPSSYSWNDFLQALSAAAEAYHTRIPLVIDGLNESTHNGAFSNVWRLGLKGLVQEITQTKNIVLITTCRGSYKEAIWEADDPPNMVYAYGFDTDEVEQAVDKHFKEYKIEADLTAAPWEQFKHPIYLKIFCESKKREPNTEEHSYDGEQTLFEVFEEYLKQCNRAVCDSLGLHPTTPIVHSALNKMAEYLWKNRCRHIPLDELVRIIDGQARDKLSWQTSKTHAIEAEGLLVYRDLVAVGEAMYFTYDLLGGYLIAKYLVQQAADNVQDFLHRKETVEALFNENRQILHPMRDDILRCLAALLPARTGQFLHNLSRNKTACGISIRALFEISPEFINEDCINLVTRLFENQQNREPLLKLAETTVGHTNHPFNASFWSERLMALPMPERDLSWTEYVRPKVESYEKRLVRFEEACRSSQKLSDISKKRLNLLAEYIMWVLTSTRRPLRDKATRALYWYGRRFPQDFLDLVIKSLSINDPYVSERMLAAAYGTAMARQHDFQDDSFTREILPLYGRKLYETMFKPKAQHSTTHILARDYGRYTIDIALIHHPGLLTDDEQRYITPPFTEGGIRKWDEVEDRNVNGYPNRNSPLHMDFVHYTLGGLLKGGDPDEYKRVQSNILWRVYDLGYSSDDFKEIDEEIAQENFRYNRSADGRKTDRYGKKYSWIAFYGLAGFRQDEGLLPEDYDAPRTIEVDIDPSFPVEQRECNLVKEDFLGDRKISAKEWVSKSTPPDLTPYLQVDRLDGEEGSWILLDGYLRQKDNHISRGLFALLRGLIVKSDESEEIVEWLRREKIDEWIVTSYPNNYYTYAGEIPWCDTYPANGWEEKSFKTGSVSAPFFHSTTDPIGIEDTEARPSEQDLEIGKKTIEAEQPECQRFKILYPVREYSWDDNLGATVAGQNVATPSRQIADTLNLCGQPQSFDLFEKNGRRASITLGRGRGWAEQQRFTYLREDLLKRYLAEINGELIWAVRGQRHRIAQAQDPPCNQAVLPKIFEDVQVYSDITKRSSKQSEGR